MQTSEMLHATVPHLCFFPNHFIPFIYSVEGFPCHPLRSLPKLFKILIPKIPLLYTPTHFLTLVSFHQNAVASSRSHGSRLEFGKLSVAGPSLKWLLWIPFQMLPKLKSARGKLSPFVIWFKWNWCSPSFLSVHSHKPWKPTSYCRSSSTRSCFWKVFRHLSTCTKAWRQLLKHLFLQYSFF